MPLVGNTIRVKAEFKDFDGEPVSLYEVVFRVYDGRKKQIGEDVPLSPEDGEIGVYYCDFVVPGNEVVGPVYFEFAGTLDDTPVLARAELERRWAD